MPLAELEPETRTIVMKTEFMDRHLVKQLPGARFQAGEQVWTAPLSWGACITLRGLFGDRLDVGPNLAAWSWEEYRSRVQPALAVRERLEPDPASDDFLDIDLRPFQRAGVGFLCSARRALLADPMGSGKTVQVIRALRRLEVGIATVFPVLVVCPNSVKAVWRDEFAKWWPEVRVSVVGGTATQRRKQLLPGIADVYVINWESVRRHSRLAKYGTLRLTEKETEPKELNDREWGAVIADEAHRMKDPKAQQTRAVWAVGQGVQYRYALTGTPIANTPDELWSILHFLDEEEWPAKTKYIDRWCSSSFNVFGGMSVIGLRADTREEFFRIVDPHLRRLPKDLLLPQLPPKVRQTRQVPMDPKQAKAYRQMEEHMAAMIEGELIIAKKEIIKLTRLIQFSSAYAEVVEDNQIVLAEPSNKIDALEELLDEMDPDEPLVVFAVSKQLINLAAARLTKRGHEIGLITGDQSPDERATAVERFQEGRLRAVLCTVAAGGVGITLTRARVVVFLQRPWSSVDNSQAEDRVHRIGSEQHDRIEVIDIITPDTIESRVRDVLGEKGERLEEIVRDKEMLIKLLGGK